MQQKNENNKNMSVKNADMKRNYTKQWDRQKARTKYEIIGNTDFY